MSFFLTVEPLGDTIPVEKGQSVLDAALRAGIWLPHACNHGLCGTCKVTVVEGEVHHNHASSFALMDMEREEGLCLACSATLASDIVIEADIEEELDSERHPVRDFDGTISRIEQLTPSIKGVWIHVDGSGVAFQAGQYINLFLPDLDIPRAFSIASSPRIPDEIELHVRKVEGGVATTYIHDKLKVGDPVKFSAPFGQFFVRKSSPEPIIFLAGGSGLSSPKSMIMDLLDSSDTREITLCYGARTMEEIYFHDFFRELEKKKQNFKYFVAVSNDETVGPWVNEKANVNELADTIFQGSFTGYKAYICGPPQMVDATITTLMRGRLFEEHIFVENFYTGDHSDGKGRRSALFKKF